MADSDSEREQKRPRQRWTEEKRSSYRRIIRPIQLGGIAFLLVGFTILFVGSGLGVPATLAIGMLIVAAAIYSWFALRWFSRFRKWQKEWDERP